MQRNGRPEVKTKREITRRGTELMDRTCENRRQVQENGTTRKQENQLSMRISAPNKRRDCGKDETKRIREPDRAPINEDAGEIKAPELIDTASTWIGGYWKC